MANKVHIIDVTNRDGVQTSRILLPKLSKTMLNVYLDEMGVYQSEVGFPTLRHEIGYINANLKLYEKGVIKNIHLEGWCRAVLEDIELTFKNCPKIKHLNISASTSDILLRGKFQGKKTFADVVKGMAEAVRAAKAQGIETIGVNAEDASRTEIERLEEFIIAGKEAGADRFRYCDTLGTEGPISMYENIKKLSERTGFPIEMHCHNDLGMAEAISIAGARAALECGIDTYINTTVNGYGERAGNADLVSILLALRFSSYFRDNPILGDNVNLKLSWRLAKYASYAFGLPIAINQPGVGANAFAHESGIHADGALKDRRNYELYDPEDVGRGVPDLLQTGRVITTGAYGGIKGFRHVYDNLGVYFATDEEARDVLELVQYANLHTQKPLTDDELRFIASNPEEVREILRVCI
ncbi:MAG: homocitrate synthase [Nitrospirae bacterium]|uniref:homocitrate synthase/isopropylmalate synthase family protein n=1 Tax=Candidatus Magnetobacterium casense TaxID=1455061 RepID=UPI00058BD8B9|nr:homocitrate synthase [Candidatus Magnetobacterium casensis]MBF0338595.1 homocitrate synthase [Nitrospirota bacterium]